MTSALLHIASANDSAGRLMSYPDSPRYFVDSHRLAQLNDLRLFLQRQLAIRSKSRFDLGVLYVGDADQMIRIHASSIGAHVVQMIARLKRANYGLVHVSVRSNRLARNVESPITRTVQPTRPIPASSGIVNGVLDVVNSALVSGEIVDEFALDPSSISTSFIGAFHRFTATAFAHTRRIGDRTFTERVDLMSGSESPEIPLHLAAVVDRSGVPSHRLTASTFAKTINRHLVVPDTNRAITL